MFIGAFVMPFLILITFCALTLRALKLKGSIQFRLVRKSFTRKRRVNENQSQFEKCLCVSHLYLFYGSWKENFKMIGSINPLDDGQLAKSSFLNAKICRRN